MQAWAQCKEFVMAITFYIYSPRVLIFLFFSTLRHSNNALYLNLSVKSLLGWHMATPNFLYHVFLGSPPPPCSNTPLRPDGQFMRWYPDIAGEQCSLTPLPPVRPNKSDIQVRADLVDGRVKPAYVVGGPACLSSMWVSRYPHLCREYGRWAAAAGVVRTLACFPRRVAQPIHQSNIRGLWKRLS